MFPTLLSSSPWETSIVPSASTMDSSREEGQPTRLTDRQALAHRNVFGISTAHSRIAKDSLTSGYPTHWNESPMLPAAAFGMRFRTLH